MRLPITVLQIDAMPFYICQLCLHWLKIPISMASFASFRLVSCISANGAGSREHLVPCCFLAGRTGNGRIRLHENSNNKSQIQINSSGFFIFYFKRLKMKERKREIEEKLNFGFLKETFKKVFLLSWLFFSTFLGSLSIWSGADIIKLFDHFFRSFPAQAKNGSTFDHLL